MNRPQQVIIESPHQREKKYLESDIIKYCPGLNALYISYIRESRTHESDDMGHGSVPHHIPSFFHSHGRPYQVVLLSEPLKGQKAAAAQRHLYQKISATSLVSLCPGGDC